MTRLKLLSLTFLLLLGPLAHGFVYYQVSTRDGDVPMRWLLSSTNLYHTNMVNPVTKKVRYFVSSDLYSTNNKTAELNAIRAAFDQWQGVPGTKVGFEEGGLMAPGLDIEFDGTNVVFWAKKSLIVGGGENLSGRRAWTYVWYSADDGRIMEADIVLNGVQNKWFTDITDTANVSGFVEQTLLHEIGHFIGLDHTPAGGASVLTGAPGINTELGLSADDIAAVRFLYPDPALKWASVRGRILQKGSGRLGAVVALMDGKGNLAGATVTRSDGAFELHSLSAGQYTLRVSPLDPEGTSNSHSLLRGEEIALDYYFADTDFRATPAIGITLTNAQSLTTNITVHGGNPPFRITSISKPTPIPDLVSISRYAYALHPGQSNHFLSVNGAQLLANSILSVTGDGITMGATVYKPNRFPGLHTLSAAIHVSSNATPGLRTIVVQNGTNYAYAHGYLEIAPVVPDHNRDGLDDMFQRKFWGRWTTNQAGPTMDPDGDHFSNAFEYRTGTNPTNAASHKFLVDMVTTDNTGTTVTWKADLGRTYRVYGRPAFNPAAPWLAVGQPVTATGPTASVFDAAIRGQVPPEKFYRVHLLPQP